MKKMFGAICAFVLTVSMMTVSAFAADYAVEPEYTLPENPDVLVTADTILAAVASGETVTFKADEVAVITKEAIAEIAKLEEPVNFVTEAVTLTIDPKDITDSAVAIDLTMEVKATEEKQIFIAPAAKGEFGFKLTITLPAQTVIDAGIDVNKAKVYYISDAGEVREIGGLVANDDGSVSISISHASEYVIAETAPETNIKGETVVPEKDTNPGTGSAPTGVASIIVLAVVSSALAVKKLKK